MRMVQGRGLWTAVAAVVLGMAASTVATGQVKTTSGLVRGATFVRQSRDAPPLTIEMSADRRVFVAT